MILTHKFVECIPDELESGILYISMNYCTAVHKCICGCGNEVVTPISRKGWKLSFDGETISLTPSIGSWNLACKSHYFITNNNVRFARKWDETYEEPKSIWINLFKKKKRNKKKKNKK
ncbi:MAG: DUF6527 family protein [Paludibacter sp.]|nr:DUF6527 family protein [Paludibacter sp.]